MGTLPREAVYIKNLRISGRFYPLQPDAYVTAECNLEGQLLAEIQSREFHSAATGDPLTLLTCSCKESLQQHTHLEATSPEIIEGLASFFTREKSDYCVHRRAIQHLIDEGELATEGDDGRELPETSVDFLSLDPLLVAVNDGSLLGPTKLKCLICSSHCDHLHYFHEWCEENKAQIELHQDLSSTGSAAPDYSILSKGDIPYHSLIL